MLSFANNRSTTAILLFLKAPRAGTVKTRLAKTIGEDEALARYRQLVERQLANLPVGSVTEVHYTPAGAGEELASWLGVELNYYPQCEGNLGQRLESATAQAFARGHQQVICIGGDCPGLGVQQVEQAINRLNTDSDVVFGPTEDGGYYLLGLGAPRSELFDEIPWSLPNTLEVSLERAKAIQLRVALLETLYDVDEAADLERAIREGLLTN